MWQALIIVGLCVVKMAIIVNGGSQNSHEGAPKFMISINNNTAILGKDAVLNCYIETLGLYKVAWMRASDQSVLTIGNMATQNSRYSVIHSELNIWSLKIHNVRESDEGCYHCQINTQPLMKQSGCIQLQYPPDISDAGSSSDTTVQEGRNVSLHCKATGNPTPRIFWRRDDGRKLVLKSDESIVISADIYNGSTLNLVNVKRDQMAAYLCIAVNGVEPAISKRILLHVQFAPNISTDFLHLSAVGEGTSVQINCLVESSPNSINYWIKESSLSGTQSNAFKQHVLEQSDKYTTHEKRISSYKTKMLLTINNINQQDAGSYVCVSSNQFGSANRTIKIYEIKLTTSTLAPTSTQTFTTTVRRIFISSTIAHTSTTTTEPSTEMDTTELYPGWNSVYYPGVESYQHHTNYINSQCSVYQRNFHLPLVSIVSLMLSLPLKIS